MKIKKISSKLLYLLPALAVFFGQFNIAYHFSSKFAYVNGFFVNYYDFVIHIVDIVLILLLGSYLIKFKLWEHKRWGLLCSVGLIFWIVHNVIFADWVVFYWSTRMLLYVLAGITIRVSMFNLESKDRKLLVNSLFGALVSVGVIQSIIIILQFSLNRTLGITFLGESVVQSGISGTSSVVLPFGTFLRGYGTFPHPNVVGGVLGICIMLMLCRLLFGVNKKRFWIIVPLVITLSGLGLTWSRSAWLFTFTSSMVSLYLFLRNKKRELGKRIMGGVLILLGFLIIWISVGNDKVSISIRDRLIEQTVGGDESVVQRQELNNRAIEMYRDNLLTGVGVGRYISRLNSHPVVSGSGLRVMQPVHNVFLLGAAELGFMALWIFSYYLYSSIKGLRDNYYYLFPLIFLVTVGLLDHYPITLPQGLLILLILDWFVILQKSIYKNC